MVQPVGTPQPLLMFMCLEVIGTTAPDTGENCPIRSPRFYFKLGQALQELTDKTYVDLEKKTLEI